LYLINPALPESIKQRFSAVHGILVNKYGFDQFNEWFFAGGARGVGGLLWKFGDVKVIDGVMVNGSAQAVHWVALIMRHVQTGLLYHYAFAMIIGLALLLGVFVIL
jgi:NADH-quinone oxidoreductase subunit L